MLFTRARRRDRGGCLARSALLAVTLMFAAACGGAADGSRLRSPLEVETLAGLTRCDGPGTLRLEGGVSLTVLVHGNNAARDSFEPLAAELALRGDQVACYRWQQRGRLTTAATDLRAALAALDALGLPRIRVLGHSLGGLGARRALVSEEGDEPLDTPMELVTVSTPFAGVASARTCGKTWLRVLSLGAVAAICRRLTRGAKWRDIHPRASLITAPGPLGPWVTEHLHVITDEVGTCRRRASTGRCLQDDAVFRVEEQDGALVADPRLRIRTLSAGHGAVIGEPAELAALLDRAPDPAAQPAREPGAR